ncbi:uncharacterized protein BDR25DRAFT_378720 [Lindgomyces ingoldianus]|uniref:Uncharacterized protein n=1 Tax=Lindgomyces ingoldianus TaxID=673940 RepID=A0ACB6QEZ4_9PLEO|nr:uncharacterized protein BDR25DRAFT_378720 [Lindgomyces ingoldianus]KAF2465553.1 hypothetical protein BDR25DRAFT_378720 [Lindgomyces ingoldianus]
MGRSSRLRNHFTFASSPSPSPENTLETPSEQQRELSEYRRQFFEYIEEALSSPSNTDPTATRPLPRDPASSPTNNESRIPDTNLDVARRRGTRIRHPDPHEIRTIIPLGSFPGRRHLRQQSFVQTQRQTPAGASIFADNLSSPIRPFSPISLIIPTLAPASSTPPAPTAIRTPQTPHPTLTHFISNHLTPIIPPHPLYPSPTTLCPICHESFHASHPPILVRDVPGCRDHVFGYACLRNWILSGMRNSNSCPLCRSEWFKVRKFEVRRIRRAGVGTGRREERGVAEADRSSVEEGERGRAARVVGLVREWGAWVIGFSGNRNETGRGEEARGVRWDGGLQGNDSGGDSEEEEEEEEDEDEGVDDENYDWGDGHEGDEDPMYAHPSVYQRG